METELSNIPPNALLCPENTNQADSCSSEPWSFNLSKAHFLPAFLITTVSSFSGNPTSHPLSFKSIESQKQNHEKSQFDPFALRNALVERAQRNVVGNPSLTGCFISNKNKLKEKIQKCFKLVTHRKGILWERAHTCTIIVFREVFNLISTKGLYQTICSSKKGSYMFLRLCIFLRRVTVALIRFSMGSLMPNE